MRFCCSHFVPSVPNARFLHVPSNWTDYCKRTQLRMGFCEAQRIGICSWPPWFSVASGFTQIFSPSLSVCDPSHRATLKPYLHSTSIRLYTWACWHMCLHATPLSKERQERRDTEDQKDRKGSKRSKKIKNIKQDSKKQRQTKDKVRDFKLIFLLFGQELKPPTLCRLKIRPLLRSNTFDFSSLKPWRGPGCKR